QGRSVLVVGGAGTIGSSYIKSLLPFKPAKLVVADINENGLTELVRDCRSRNDLQLPAEFKSYPVNFGDRVFEKIFTKEGPFHIVANFAAHKHVRSEKDVFSIEAMLENNVIRAKRFLDQLLVKPPEHFFCVSTDKAANPVNIMGASKKLMEEVILAYAGDIKITTARFANVAFSNGSLLAGFVERIMKQQPLSCPADVKRYFVSPVEAGEICLMSCMLGNSGEIFFPKLQPEKDLVLFKTIAIDFLEQIGYLAEECASEEEARQKAKQLNGKYPVFFFESDTSGEKLYEEFYTEGETIEMERFQSLGVVTNAARRKKKELDKVITALENLFESDTQKESVVKVLNELLPTFQHVETGLNLDQKM
ncbi:MAG TPA: UDP-N-acetylglucosamine 4,6-dehydratase, partial [Chitinophagaceae bacterium]|nr:UDP-N-acetylglucosamine 4,6-dehydratase [Chitinophagaceae bacterium]